MKVPHQIENLLKESENNYDRKNKTNKGLGVVSNSIIEMIETSGITSEMLESFPFPIFRYKTQVTLHGVFNLGIGSYTTGGYRNLIVNQNRSLGVRYSAIDIKKKHFIATVLRLEKSKFHCYIDSVSCNIFYIKDFNEANLETAKEIFSRLPKNFTGNSQLYISKDFLGKFIVIKIELNAIYEKEIFPFLAGLLEKPYSLEIYQANKSAKELADQKRNQEMEIEIERKRKLRDEAFERAKNKFFKYVPIVFIHTFSTGRYLFLEYAFERLQVRCLHVYKTKNGMLMYYISDIYNLKSIPDTCQFDSRRKRLHESMLAKIKTRLMDNFYFKLKK